MVRIPLLTLSALLAAACSAEPEPRDDGYAPPPLPAPTGDELADLRASVAALQGRAENTVERVTVQHVLLSFAGRGTRATRSEAEAERLAAEVYRKAVVDGVEFTELMAAHSDDTGLGTYAMVTNQTRRGGGVYPRSGMVPAFGDVGWRLRIGEVGVAPYEADKSPFGWHVIKRIE